jgi:hypothetical protein
VTAALYRRDIIRGVIETVAVRCGRELVSQKEIQKYEKVRNLYLAIYKVTNNGEIIPVSGC